MMDEKPPAAKDPNEGPYTAYMVVAFVCGFASAGIVCLLFVFAQIQVTTEGLWPLAMMVLAPTILGIGVCYSIYKSSTHTKSP